MSNNHPASIFDADAARRGDVDREAIQIDHNGRPVALIVDVKDVGSMVFDTTTADGVRVVTMEVPFEGMICLDAAETLAVARALLSRLAFIGFPEDVDMIGDAA